jgi:hypothetical protein
MYVIAEPVEVAPQLCGHMDVSSIKTNYCDFSWSVGSHQAIFLESSSVTKKSCQAEPTKNSQRIPTLVVKQ